MAWQFASSTVSPYDPIMRRLWKEAIDAVPPGFLTVDRDGSIVTEADIPFMSRTKTYGYCSLCGEWKELTKEHIPPKQSGNKGRFVNKEYQQWLNYGVNEPPSIKRKVEQGGIYGYSLCEECNSFTGNRYGSEYIQWSAVATSYLDSISSDDIQVMHMGSGPYYMTFEVNGHPGAFVRQALSIVCSLSGRWNLAERYPEIRSIVLEGEPGNLPVGHHLELALFMSPNARFGGPQLLIDRPTESWKWVIEMGYSPFSLLYTVASNRGAIPSRASITNLTRLQALKRQFIRLDLEVGFGWSYYPGDYRPLSAFK